MLQASSACTSGVSHWALARRGKLAVWPEVARISNSSPPDARGQAASTLYTSSAVCIPPVRRCAFLPFGGVHSSHLAPRCSRCMLGLNSHQDDAVRRPLAAEVAEAQAKMAGQSAWAALSRNSYGRW